MILSWVTYRCIQSERRKPRERETWVIRTWSVAHSDWRRCRADATLTASDADACMRTTTRVTRPFVVGAPVCLFVQHFKSNIWLACTNETFYLYVRDVLHTSLFLPSSFQFTVSCWLSTAMLTDYSTNNYESIT